MKKILNKKVLGALLALVLALGIVDLTVLEQSNLKPILDTLQERATSVFEKTESTSEDVTPLFDTAEKTSAE